MIINYDTTTGASQTVFPLERVRMLSAHEGTMATSASGDSLYKDVRVTKGDEDYIVGVIEEGLRLVEQMMGTLLLAQATYDGKKAEFDFLPSCRLRNDNSLTDALAECAAEYAMSRWLEIRLPSRAEGYLSRFADKAKSAVILAAEKPLPTLREEESEGSGS